MSLKQKVTDLLNEADSDVIHEFFHSELTESTRWDSDEVTEFRKKLSDAGIRFEHVDNYGGEEQGREYWSVYSFHDASHVVYVQFDGWYQSYNGSEYEEWFFVEPRQVQVTQFKRA